MINISLQPEYIVALFGIPISNTLLSSLLVTVILATVSIIFYIRKERSGNLFFDGLKVFVFDILRFIDVVTRDRALSKRVLPLIATFFLFILTANLIELVPGFLGSLYVQTDAQTVSLLRSPNSDLNITLALGIFSVVAIQFFSLRILGLKTFLRRFMNFSSPIDFILGFFEMISESVKILSFSFRLFGNIFAGEILLIIVAFLVPYIIPIPFMILEVFVGVIQAFIFSMLTLTFIKISTMRHMKPQT